ncbi:sigma-54-dependent Fis family transcriptional regulator [Bacillus norwichensis]|uniref:sigma-54-dependent Fis family transcriptional regulator n=1 Tax=Bacillus norwichensis TaxID=2762217 RepID=UPI00296F7A39|nr:sigma-54-dependent Fis family transcriptional regulator [Bacillus norwichensis]
MNTYLALHSTDNLHVKMRELESQWGYFVSDKQKPVKVRQTIYQSWKRCEEYQVDPLQKQTSIIIDDQRLDETLSHSEMYKASLPIVESLHQQVQGTGHLITLADDKGTIIHLEGDQKIKQQAAEMSFIRGADWSEKAAGSNAIGTGLAVGHPIQIFSHEHYCEGVHPWICSAAPIKDPLTGKVLGIIDLTGPRQLVQPHSLSVVQNISKMIQHNFKTHSLKQRHQLQKFYEGFVNKWKSDSVIMLDEMLNIVHADPKCLFLLQIDHWKQLAAHQEFHHIRNSLLTNNEYEWELDVPSLQIKVFIQVIVQGSERIGYLLHLEKTNQIRNYTYWGRIIGNSQPMNQLIARAKIVAPTNVSILLTGESGTGKEVFARAIHKESSRSQSPFIAINCGAIPKELMASELFGYEPGAFTGGNPKGKAGRFEEADGGTLLLDEIGEMPLDLQVHLLRVLQEKEIVRLGTSRSKKVDVRIIAATNRNMRELIAERKFREDLYYRLNVVEFQLPSLRERKEDIPLLTRYYIIHYAKKHDKPVPTIGNEVLSLLNQYHWPGNIRELTNTIEYAVLFCSNNHITMDSLPDFFRDSSQGLISEHHELTVLEQEEKNKIKQLIEETGGNLSEVARRCKIARTTLYRKIEKYQLKVT